MTLLQLEYLLISMLRTISVEANPGIVFLNGDDFHKSLVEVIINYFKENIRERLTLDDICRKVSYSHSFLCRTFKEQTGETLIECFNRMKIEESKHMLETTELSSAQIAAELGFCDPKYFSTLFKKITGSSPLKYRRENTKRNEV